MSAVGAWDRRRWSPKHTSGAQTVRCRGGVENGRGVADKHVFINLFARSIPSADPGEVRLSAKAPGLEKT